MRNSVERKDMKHQQKKLVKRLDYIKQEILDLFNCLAPTLSTNHQFKLVPIIDKKIKTNKNKYPNLYPHYFAKKIKVMEKK